MELMTAPSPVGKSNILQFEPKNGWAHEEVREELNHILRNKLFVKSVKLSCFLRTAVEYLLAGRADEFKEYVIGVEVYGRTPSYDPNQDSIVRTEARRLRAKLNEYYSRNRSNTSIMILFEPGSYVPVITTCAISTPTDDLELHYSLPRTSHTQSVAVYPFCARSGGRTTEQLASDLTDDLIYQLSRQERISLFSACPGVHLDPFEQLRIWSGSGVEFVVQGKVYLLDDEIAVDVQLTTLPGMILWSKRFEGKRLAELPSGLPETILAAVSSQAGSSKLNRVAFN